jgi:hypothetical protein
MPSAQRGPVRHGTDVAAPPRTPAGVGALPVTPSSGPTSPPEDPAPAAARRASARHALIVAKQRGATFHAAACDEKDAAAALLEDLFTGLRALPAVRTKGAARFQANDVQWQVLVGLYEGLEEAEQQQLLRYMLGVSGNKAADCGTAADGKPTLSVATMEQRWKALFDCAVEIALPGSLRGTTRRDAGDRGGNPRPSAAGAARRGRGALAGAALGRGGRLARAQARR